MLLFPSVVGILVMIYGAVTAFVTNPAHSFCDDSDTVNLTICRACPNNACPFTSVFVLP